MQNVNTKRGTQWLPSLSGYTLAGNCSLELYMLPAENPEDMTSYICVPIKNSRIMPKKSEICILPPPDASYPPKP